MRKLKKMVESENESVKKNDGRLFNNELLYCEGREKSYLRGKLHFCCLFIFPTLFWLYFEAGHENIKAILIGWFYLLMNFFAYSVSAAFHIGSWSKSQEIVIHKIDHCFVAIYVLSKYMPMSLLLLPPYIGMVHFSAATLVCIWNNYNICLSKPNSLRLAVLAGVQFPFLYFYYQYMTGVEWNCNCIALISQSIAGFIFVKEITPSWFNPKIATFHEIYHFISLITGAAMWLLNYSIIKRHSNSY